MKKTIWVGLTVFLGLSFFSFNAFGGKSRWNADLSKGESEISFDGIGRPSFVHVHGKSSHGLQGTLEDRDNAVSGFGVFSLASLETGISLRDRHMKTCLEVEKYPTSKLMLFPIAFPGSETQSTFRGTLELHGQKGIVNGIVKLRATGNGLRAHFSFPIKLSEFHIVAPSFAKITLQDSVQISVEGNFPTRALSDLAASPTK